MPSKILLSEWAEAPRPRQPQPDDVIATQRIWRDRPMLHRTKPMRTLAYKPGDVIPREDADALNVQPDGTQGVYPNPLETT